MLIFTFDVMVDNSVVAQTAPKVTIKGGRQHSLDAFTEIRVMQL